MMFVVDHVTHLLTRGSSTSTTTSVRRWRTNMREFRSLSFSTSVGHSGTSDRYSNTGDHHRYRSSPSSWDFYLSIGNSTPFHTSTSTYSWFINERDYYRGCFSFIGTRKLPSKSLRLVITLKPYHSSVTLDRGWRVLHPLPTKTKKRKMRANRKPIKFAIYCWYDSPNATDIFGAGKGTPCEICSGFPKDSSNSIDNVDHRYSITRYENPLPNGGSARNSTDNCARFKTGSRLYSHSRPFLTRRSNFCGCYKNYSWSCWVYCECNGRRDWYRVKAYEENNSFSIRRRNHQFIWNHSSHYPITKGIDTSDSSTHGNLTCEGNYRIPTESLTSHVSSEEIAIVFFLNHR